MLLTERHPRLQQIKKLKLLLALSFFIYLDDQRMLRSFLTSWFRATFFFLGWNAFKIFYIDLIDSGLGVCRPKTNIVDSLILYFLL